MLIERIGKARKTIHYETFLWKKGKLGHRMATALAERAREGDGILDAKTATRFDAVFDKHVKRAEEIDVERWAKRSFFHKLKDHAAYSIKQML